MTGLSTSLQDSKDSRKTAVTNDELKRLNLDIATLQETRLADSGTLKEKDYTFFWQGKRSNEPRENGVGFVVRNSLLRMVEPDTKDMFYENLAAIIRNIPSRKQVVVLGDFNARVGADHDSWPSCPGQFGVGKMNENGQRLVKLCTFHDLRITNSFFRTKPQHRVSWRHPRSKHWNQLDLILVRRAAINNVLHTRSYHSADCDTDHSLVCCKIRMQPKKFNRTRTKGIPRIDVFKMSQPDLMEQFAQTFEKELGSLQPGDSATEKWEALRDTMYGTALATFGKRSSKSHDWFEAKSTVMTPSLKPSELPS